MAEKRKSLAVLQSLISKLKESDKKDELFDLIVGVLIKEGICSEFDVTDRMDRFEQLVAAVELKMRSGFSYNEAYKRVIKKYPEFNINLN